MVNSGRTAYALDVMRRVLSRSFDRNVVVFLKVDPGVAAGEQLAEDTADEPELQSYNSSTYTGLILMDLF